MMDASPIKVYLRVKPAGEGEEGCIEQISGREVTIRNERLWGNFAFEKVFDSEADQESVFETSIAPQMRYFLDGFNAACIAYGQTGSGKTYSMGTSFGGKCEDVGIIPRFFDRLFRETSNWTTHPTVHASFVELYNEEIIDLLQGASHSTSSSPSKFFRPSSPFRTTPPSTPLMGIGLSSSALRQRLEIREDPSGGGTQIVGISEVELGSLEEALSYLQKAGQARRTATTALNDRSSRSHAIFTITLRQTKCLDTQSEPTSPDGSRLESKTDQAKATIVSKFRFVDLAGSERLKRTKSEGNQKAEGIAINQGLLVLGRVIDALEAQSQARRARPNTPNPVVVPYRESKLTRILQDSLGGNSKTSIIACVSPAKTDYHESISTLKYATRAQSIQNVCSINVKSVSGTADDQLARFAAEIALLKSKMDAQKDNYETIITSLRSEISSSPSRSILESEPDQSSHISDDETMVQRTYEHRPSGSSIPALRRSSAAVIPRLYVNTSMNRPIPNKHQETTTDLPDSSTYDIADSLSVETGSSFDDDLDSCLEDVGELKRAVLDALTRVRELKAQCGWAMNVLEEREARAARWDSGLDVKDCNDAAQTEEPQKDTKPHRARESSSRIPVPTGQVLGSLQPFLSWLGNSMDLRGPTKQW